MALTELGIKQAKPQEKDYMLRDDKGLYLLIKPNGGKYWRLRYWKEKKEVRVTLGVYPTVTLKEAREKRDTLRKGISEGVDPKEASQAAIRDSEAVFENIVNEWFLKKVKNVRAESHYSKVWYRVERFLLPVFGPRNIRDITAPEILVVLRRLEDRGIIDTAHRVMNYCSQIFRYAIATGRAERDPTADLRGALQPIKSKHRAALTEPAQISQLLRAMDAFDGTFVVKCAVTVQAFPKMEEEKILGKGLPVR